MRDIKFRALLKKDQKIYKVLHLYWVEDHSYISKPTVLLDDNKISYPTYKYDDIVLMQYAGLKDKNGKEIYEGDILKDNIGIKVEMKWDEYRAGWKETPNSIKFYDWEIIGNIYENPELLAQQSSEELKGSTTGEKHEE